MAKPRLHLDADVSYRALQRVLQERGHDVTRTPCEWMPLEAGDEQQLLQATARARCILTFNISDFMRLAQIHPTHGGIVLAHELESYLWGAATILRGLVDAGDYKQFIFPLLFYKRLCDVWDEEYAEALAETGDEDYALARRTTACHPRRRALERCARGARDVGQAIQTAMRAIEAANPDRLDGIFGDAPWTNKERLPDATLKNLLEHFSKAHALAGQRARGRAGQRLRVPDQEVRRRQRPHRAGVLHQPHRGAPDGADARPAAGRVASTTPPAAPAAC
jgi:hypothetical protein